MKRKANIFGFGRKAATSSRSRSSSLTIASASKQAREAGYKGKDFREWLDAKGLADRSQGVLDRLGDAYRAGMDLRARDDEEKERVRDAGREKARAKKAGQEETQRRAQKLTSIDTKALERHYASGGTLQSFLRENPGPKSQKFERCVKAVAKRYGVKDPNALCAAAVLRSKRNPIPAAAIGAVNDYLGYAATGAAVEKGAGLGSKLMRAATKGMGRRNPAGASARAYEDFHGAPPQEFVTVKRQVHVHRHLAGAGVLRKLRVEAIDGRGPVGITFYSGKDSRKQTILAFNEKRNQLFVEGGDQAVDLKSFGIRKEHELETLGRVLSIDYFTTKDHLGDEGGTAIYGHKFRTVNQDGNHVTVRVARYPDLIYRVLDQQLEFSGGSYEILAEGINQ